MNTEATGHGRASAGATPGTHYPLIVGVLIVLAVAAVYGQTAGFDFVDFDDGMYILDNARVRSGLTAENVRWAVTSFSVANWHPLTWLSHMTDVTVFGLDAGGHHLISVGLHAMNSVLLLYVLMLYTGDIRKCAFIAAVFALHPLHVESVAWISERKDLLSGFFWILSMGLYARYARRPSPARMGQVSAAFAMGLMAKPMAVTLPLILLVMDDWPLRRMQRRCERSGASPETKRRWGGYVMEKWPLFLLAGISAVLTLAAQHRGGAVASLTQLSLPERIRNAIDAYGWYLWKTAVPLDLAAFYPHDPTARLWTPLAGLAVITTVTAWAYAHRRRYPAVWAGWLWFGISLLPVIGIIQVGGQATADRYMYLPMIGLLMAMAGFPYQTLCRAWQRFPVRVGVAAAAVGMWALLTVPQVATWQDSRHMARHALAVTSGNYLMHTVKGNVLSRAGRFDAALGHYDAAIRIKPDFEEAYHQKGRLLVRMGRLEAAEALFHIVLDLNPRYVDAIVDLADMAVARRQYDDAIRYYRRALVQQPELVRAHNNLAMVHQIVGNRQAAVSHLNTAVRISPGFVDARMNLGAILTDMGAFRGALHHYQAVLHDEPGPRGLYYNIGNLMLRSGQLERAVSMYRKHLRWVPTDADCYNNVGIARVRQGRIDLAINAFAAAHRLNPAASPFRKNLLKLRNRHDG